MDESPWHMAEMLGLALSAVFIGAMVFMLIVFVRFSIISPIKTRGAAARLRVPDVKGVEQICGFSLPEEIASFFRDDPMVSMTEFELVDKSSDPAKRWPVASFNPLAPVDVREELVVTRVPGVPIASDGSKGAYYLSAQGTIRVQSPNGEASDLLVAPTLSAFRAFDIREYTDDDDDPS